MWGRAKFVSDANLGNVLKEKVRHVLGGSLHIRHVDTGSCNGCDFEMSVLSNPIYDISRYGVSFVPSPRQADMLMVTGGVTQNLAQALKATYDATPEPKLVLAVGSCACGGGIWGKTYATSGGIDLFIPVDIYIPGCPPRPESLIQGILTAIDRYDKEKNGR